MILFFILLIKKEVSRSKPLSFIPNEFDDLRQRALLSARKRINQINNDDAIIPNKPYIKDEFIGFVNNALFSATVSNLKGYALSEESKHIAIIVNRKTKDGIEMMKEKSMFADQQTNSVYSLFIKYADDGEVAIYNISKIDPFQIFDRFQITLPKSSFEGQCSDTGKNFGGRCWIETSLNWGDDVLPGNSEVKVGKFKFSIYYGLKARAETSIIIKKSGAINMQAEMDSSFDLVGCIGIRIPEFNMSLSQFDQIKELSEEIIKPQIIPIFTLSFEIRVLLVFQPILNHFEAEISKPISFFKVFKLHLKKNVIVSTKHQKTCQTEKDFHIETLLENGEIDDDDDFKTEARINGSFYIKAGIRAELRLGQLLSEPLLSIEGGVKPRFDFEFTRNTTQCTAPAMFGVFTPTINAYVNCIGQIKIGFVKLFKISKEKLFEILTFDGHLGSCMYNDEDSKELDDDLIDHENKELDILLFDNFKATKDGIYSIANNLSNPDRFYNKYFFLERNDKAFYPSQSFIITEKKYNFTNLRSHVRYNNSVYYSNKTELLNLSDNFHYNGNLDLNKIQFDFSIGSYKSRPVSFGREFDINSSEYINSQPSGISDFPYNLGLIYKVNKNYHAHYDDYLVINEYEDALHDDSLEQNDVYQTTDYSSFRITIELNDKSDTLYCVNRTVLRVYHIQEKDEHLLYVTLFECVNSQIDESFDSSLIYVPLTETKGNINCIKIEFGEDSFYLTRNDMIRPKNSIIKVSEHFTYNITIEYPKYPDYIFQLNKPKIDLANQSIKGIVARFFQFRNTNIVPFDGVPQTISFRMGKNEAYGIYRGLFNRHGENLSNLYAIIRMPKMQPLTNDAELIESGSYFVKLVQNVTLFKRNNNIKDNFYDIIIPFRRRKLQYDDNLEITLMMIFQAEESSKDPYCSPFSKFSFQRNNNMHAGCIHNMTINSWEHFTSSDIDIIREQEVSIPDSSYKLHCINLKDFPIEETNEITVYATSKYIQFPLTSRFMIIEEDTAELMKKYCNGEYLQVICKRCDRIAIERDDFNIEMIKSPHFNDIFMIMIDDSFNSSFPLIAYCDSNSSTYCTFQIDITNDGYVLVDYNTNYNENDEFPDDSPGVEEVYPINFYRNSTDEPYDLNATDQIRLDSGFMRQILHRNDIILATKPWQGGIIPTYVHMEEMDLHLTLTYCHSSLPDSFDLSLHDQNGYDIPFSGRVFFHYLNSSENYVFEQIGINVDFSSTEADIGISMNSEGHIVVNKTMFNAKAIKDIPKGSKFELIDLPEGNYSIKFGGCTNTNPVKPKKWKIYLSCSICGAIIIAVVLYIVIKKIIKKREQKKNDDSGTVNDNSGALNDHLV